MEIKAERTEISDLINELHNSICVISDSIGFSIEAMDRNIPELRIDTQALTKRLLTDGVSHINRCVRALDILDDMLVE